MEESQAKAVQDFLHSALLSIRATTEGRYREFTQAGVEILGPVTDETKALAEESLKEVLDQFGIEYSFNDSVARGLQYYVDYGFEAEVDYLGSQKQIAGGGAAMNRVLAGPLALIV